MYRFNDEDNSRNINALYLITGDFMSRPIVYLTQEVHKDVIKLIRSRFTLRIIRKSGPRS
jgi:hypothetical protein